MTHNTLKFDADSFQQRVKSREGTAVVDFFADWCGPCRAVAPVIDEVADATAGRSVVGKIDVEAHPELAAEYGVRSIPTLIFFRDGVETDRIVGAASRGEIESKLASTSQAPTQL